MSAQHQSVSRPAAAKARGMEIVRGARDVANRYVPTSLTPEQRKLVVQSKQARRNAHQISKEVSRPEVLILELCIDDLYEKVAALLIEMRRAA